MGKTQKSFVSRTQAPYTRFRNWLVSPNVEVLMRLTSVSEKCMPSFVLQMDNVSSRSPVHAESISRRSLFQY